MTLNPGIEIPEASVINRTTLTHPLYSFESMDTQDKLRVNNGRQTLGFAAAILAMAFTKMQFALLSKSPGVLESNCDIEEELISHGLSRNF